MTCAGAETWLLTARSASGLPAAVRAHLAECRGCARRLASLKQTDSAVRKLAPGVSASNTAARQRLADAIQRTPQSAPTTPAPEATPKPVRRVPGWAIGVGAGLAAAVLVAVGWIAGRATSPKAIVQAPAPSEPAPAAPAPQPQPPVVKVPSIPVFPEVPVAPYPRLPAGLAARAARHAAHVAADALPTSQAESLEQFAADVRAEVMRRAHAGDADGLPRLTGLHERLLKLGVARQVARAPKDQRPAMATRTAEHLAGAADEVAAATAQLPVPIGKLIKPLVTACRETAESIREGKVPPAPADWPAPATPLETVVAQTLRVADANDALSRANESTELACALAQVAAVLSTAEQTDDAGRVGDSIATVLDAGVALNLERVESSNPGGTLLKEVELVRDRADKSMEPLEREVAKANPIAKPGLEKALVASAPGHAKATGKPSKHGKGGVPPGSQKK
jgi:hypothetical protein